MLKQQAVLFRTSSHSGPLEIELTRRNIPFVKFGGLKFLDAAHLKDMLALLRFVENPRDRVAGFRLMQLMPGVARPRRSACSTSLSEVADPIGELANAPMPPRVDSDDWRALSRPLVICVEAARDGRPNWSTLVYGTNRTSTASMMMPSSAVRI